MMESLNDVLARTIGELEKLREAVANMDRKDNSADAFECKEEDDQIREHFIAAMRQTCVRAYRLRSRIRRLAEKAVAAPDQAPGKDAQQAGGKG